MARRINRGKQKEIISMIRTREKQGGGAKRPALRGITKGEFHRILDKASQPKESEIKSDREQS